MLIEKKMDKLEVPVCDRCCREMEELPISEPVYEFPLRGGYMVPIAHRHHFQCQHCIPPSVVIEVPYKG